MFDHATPARFWADEDLNVAFPRDRMAELEAEGAIGALAPEAVSILGSITKWDEMATDTAPRIHDEFARQKVDLVLVVPFCPQCHQADAVLARALEARGLPTLMLSTLRDISEAYRPPRTALVDYPIGSPCGRVGDPEHQRATLRAALACPLDTTSTPVARRRTALSSRRRPRVDRSRPGGLSRQHFQPQRKHASSWPT